VAPNVLFIETANSLAKIQTILTLNPFPAFSDKGKETVVCVVMFLQSIAASSTSLPLACHVILFGN
jgi:hypothetical protein